MTNPSHIPKKDIEKHTIDLILAYEKESGGPIRPPVPVFDIIEYLGYDIDFRSDGFYQDPNNLGGLHIDEKLVVINEKISGHEGRMNFTAAHEIGHIQLHVPELTKNKKKDTIMCRNVDENIKSKRDPKEVEADMFAAYLLMPSKEVRSSFFRMNKKPFDLSKKRFMDLFRTPRTKRQKGVRIANKIIEIGNFDNVSRLAMLNRLIGLGLIRGLGYQKAIGV